MIKSLVHFLCLLAPLHASSCLAAGPAYDQNPESDANYRYQKPTIQGDLTDFEDQKVIVMYRGIHFLSDKFTQQQRQDYSQTNHVNHAMFASAAYELAGEPLDSLNSDALQPHGQAIAQTINDLDFQDGCTINGREYWSPRYAFQELYSNNCSKFFQQLQAPVDVYAPIFDQFHFNQNPLLSFSDHIKHPGKYAFGLKNYGTNQALLPDYDLQGRPHHPILGKLFGIVLDAAAVEELMPLNVKLAHDSGALKLYTHYSNDILSEREISIAGYVPAECVVFEMPLQVPSFHRATMPTYYSQKYGLTGCRYKNFRSKFTNPLTSAADKITASQKLMNGIIEASSQDNKLVYQNCLAPCIRTLFEKELTQRGAVISKLDLDYELM